MSRFGDNTFSILNGIGSLVDSKVKPPYTTKQISEASLDKDLTTNEVRSSIRSLVEKGYVKERVLSYNKSVYYPSSSFPKELDTLDLGYVSILHPIAQRNLKELGKKGFWFENTVEKGDERYNYAVHGLGPKGEPVIYHSPKATMAAAVVTTPKGNISVRDLLRLKEGDKPSSQTTRGATEDYLPKSKLWKDPRYLRQVKELDKLGWSKSRAVSDLVWKAKRELEKSVESGSDKYLKDPIKVDLEPVRKGRAYLDKYNSAHPGEDLRLAGIMKTSYGEFCTARRGLAEQLSKESGLDSSTLGLLIEDDATARYHEIGGRD